MANMEQKPVLHQNKVFKSSSLKKAFYNSLNQKINCDQLVNDYLQFSLAGNIGDQIQYTKKWLNSNKDEGKRAVRRAERQIQKSYEKNCITIKNLLKTEKKRVTDLIVLSSKQNSPPKIFNAQEMQKIVTEREESDAKRKKKMEHMKNIDNYLQQISRLKTKKKSESHQKQNKGPYQQREGERIAHRTEVSDCKSLNNSGFNVTSTFQSRNVSPFKLENITYHPFLERNLGMLYESKKKSTSKKFQLNKNRTGKYY